MAGRRARPEARDASRRKRARGGGGPELIRRLHRSSSNRLSHRRKSSSRRARCSSRSSHRRRGSARPGWRRRGLRPHRPHRQTAASCTRSPAASRRRHHAGSPPRPLPSSRRLARLRLRQCRRHPRRQRRRDRPRLGRQPPPPLLATRWRTWTRARARSHQRRCSLRRHQCGNRYRRAVAVGRTRRRHTTRCFRRIRRSFRQPRIMSTASPAPSLRAPRRMRSPSSRTNAVRPEQKKGRAALLRNRRTPRRCSLPRPSWPSALRDHRPTRPPPR